MSVRILAISGKRAAGKDTLGTYLVNRYGGTQYRFADTIKRLCVELLDVPAVVSVGDNEAKKALLPSGLATVREAQQRIGCWFRDLDPHVWVRDTLRRIERERPSLAVVTDARFPNEVDRIRRAGGKVIRLLRTADDFPTEVDRHISETALDSYCGFDAIVDNRAVSSEFTRWRVEGFLREWKWIS